MNFPISQAMNKKILALAAVAITMSLISCATRPVETEETTTGKCLKGNCQYGVGEYLFPNGNRYEGEFRSSVPFGYGTMYYKNGVVLKGKWKWGRPDLR